MTAEQGFAAASIVVSLIALGISTLLLGRQNKQLEHERNALAILDAIARLTDPAGYLGSADAFIDRVLAEAGTLE